MAVGCHSTAFWKTICASEGLQCNLKGNEICFHNWRGEGRCRLPRVNWKIAKDSCVHGLIALSPYIFFLNDYAYHCLPNQWRLFVCLFCNWRINLSRKMETVEEGEKRACWQTKEARNALRLEIVTEPDECYKQLINLLWNFDVFISMELVCSKFI